MVPCGRLSWLLVSFWAHVDILHRIVNSKSLFRYAVIIRLESVPRVFSSAAPESFYFSLISRASFCRFFCSCSVKLSKMSCGVGNGSSCLSVNVENPAEPMQRCEPVREETTPRNSSTRCFVIQMAQHLYYVHSLLQFNLHSVCSYGQPCAPQRSDLSVVVLRSGYWGKG